MSAPKKQQPQQPRQIIYLLDPQVVEHAQAEDLALMTHNIKHFDGIDGLKLEDWPL